MNDQHLPNTVLLVLGIIVLAKSIWGLAAPSSVKRVSSWWGGVARHVNTLIGCVCVLAGVALWTVVLFDQPLTNWLLVIFGTLYVWAGTVYFRPSAFQKLLNVMILDRKPAAIRALFLVMVILSVFFIWIAVKGLNFS